MPLSRGKLDGIGYREATAQTDNFGTLMTGLDRPFDMRHGTNPFDVSELISSEDCVKRGVCLGLLPSRGILWL